MSHIDITHEHSLPTSEVKKLVKTVADDLATRYGGSYEMTDTGTKFKGPGVEGVFEIMEGAVRIQANLGFLMRPLKKVFEDQINNEMIALIEKYEAPKVKKATKASKKTTAKKTGK